MTAKGGDYTEQPPSLRTAASLIYFMGSNPILRQEQMPTLAKSDEVLEQTVATAMRDQDANDVLYQLSASWDTTRTQGWSGSARR